jgi:hypothetical protein
MDLKKPQIASLVGRLVDSFPNSNFCKTSKMAVTSEGGSAEWGEICDDDGFIYRRRRHTGDQASVASDPAAEAPELMEESEAELRRWRRQKRLICLKSLRDKYKTELDKWERLSSTLNLLFEEVPEQPRVDLRSKNVDGSQSVSQLDNRGHDHLVDKLLIQVGLSGMVK